MNRLAKQSNKWFGSEVQGRHMTPLFIYIIQIFWAKYDQNSTRWLQMLYEQNLSWDDELILE